MGKEKIFNILSLVNKVLQFVFEALAKAKNKGHPTGGMDEGFDYQKGVAAV